MTRMLILDADRDYANTIAARCRAHGLTVQTAFNAIDATVKINLNPPDIICVDAAGSELDGLTLCEYLAWNSSTRSIPIIIMTLPGRIDSNRRCCTMERAYFVEKDVECWGRVQDILAEFGGFDIKAPIGVSQNAVTG